MLKSSKSNLLIEASQKISIIIKVLKKISLKENAIKQLFLLFAITLMLLEVILIFGAFGLMGKFGKTLFEVNFKFFGIFSYAYPPILLYLGYLYLKHKKINARYIELSLAYIFLFLILLVLQASSLGLGVLGKAVIDFLEPYLGGFGIWILCIFWMLVCLLSLSDQDILELSQKIDFSKILTLLKALTIQIKHSKFLKQIPHSCKKMFQIQWRPTPLIKESPLIEPQDSPTPSLEHQEEMLKEVIPSKKMIKTKKTMENLMFKNEKIKIQEVFITPEKKDQKTKIRIVDELTPPKENPFLQNDFPKEAQGISTSAELLKKIKNQDLQTNPQEKQTLETKSIQPPKINASNTNLQTHTPTFQDFQNTPYNHSMDVFSSPSPQKVETNATPQELESSFSFDSLSIEHSHDSLQSQMPSISQPSLQSPLTQTPQIEQIQEEEKIPETQTPEIQTLKTNTPEEKQIPSHRSPSSLSSLQKPKITHIKSLEENEALLKEIDQGEIIPPKDYKLPSMTLLSPAPKYENEVDENEVDAKIQSLLAKLAVFKIDGDVIRTYSGPIITTFEFRPAPNVKVSRIQSLESDIAMALEAKSIRIQAPIPGKNVVGIEIPNSSSQTIYLREIFESEIFQNSTSPLTLALGKDVVGNPFITDLKKLPHLLIAGTTGSGKSVGVNAMILSLLYHNSPDDLKLMMVDPKMVEFMPYSDLPHLITPIITDPKKAVIGLANAVREMERRYMLMSQSRTKEIVSYNQKAEELGLEKFPYFVIIIDELADLMMTAGKEVEYSMARIAQMGRASGMHLIVATQSPRAEVLTGLIKTNLPAHLSYKVGTKIDAGIIGCAGAETLLGRGDMLFTPPGMSGLVRLHAPWSSEEEINQIISYIKSQREVAYDASFLPEEKEVFGAMDCENLDEETSLLLSQAKQIILQDGKTSISYLQRRLSIGYNKAADLIEKLEQIGFLSEADSKGNRKIL